MLDNMRHHYTEDERLRIALWLARVTRDRVLRAEPLAITPVSAVGAGGSSLGALVFGLASGAALKDCFRQAVAAGAAALLNRGTGLCLPGDVKRPAEQVVLTVA